MSLTDKISQFARSPKGRQLVDKAQQAANKPENRAKIEQMRAKLMKKR